MLSDISFAIMSDCGSCCDPLPDSEEFCICSFCALKYHFQCAEILETTWNRMGQKRRDSWKCKNCTSKSPIPKDMIGKLHEEFLKKMEDTIKTQFKEYDSKFTSQLSDLKVAVEFCSSKIDEYETKVLEFNSKIVSLEKSQNQLKMENATLKQELSNYQIQLECLEQYNRNKNLQIEGIPEVSNENMPDIIGKLSDFINEPIDYKSDIQAAHRIPTRRSRGPRPIIIQLSDRKKRDSLLRKSKKIKLVSKNFCADVPETNVYVNEHLTPYTKNLLFHAKKLKQQGYKYIWTWEGKIFAKKDDNGERMRISSVQDLKKLGIDVIN